MEVKMKVYICTPLALQAKTKVSSNQTKMVAVAKAYLGKDIEVISNIEKEVPDLSDNLKIVDYVASQLEPLGECDYFVCPELRFGFKECGILKTIAECLGIQILTIRSQFLDFEEEKEDEKAD